MKQNRRTFIKTSAVASAAVMVMPSCMKTTTATQPEIGLGLYTIRDQMAANPKGTLEKIAKMGYKTIEPFGFNGRQVFGMGAKEFKGIIDDLGLKFVSGHCDPVVFEERFEESLEFMNFVGQQYAAFPYLPADQRNIDRYKQIAATLNRCGEMAKSSGITICYHNHDFEFQEIDGQFPIDILANESDPELVKFELDLYWVSKAGYDPIEQFNKFKGRVPLWHVKDMADTPEQGFAEVGEGTIDYKTIFAAKEISGMKYFFVEQDQSDDPMKSIEISINNLTQKILV